MNVGWSGQLWAKSGQGIEAEVGGRELQPPPQTQGPVGGAGAGPAGQSWALGPCGPAWGFLVQGTWPAVLARRLLGQDLGGEAVEKAGVLTPTQGQGRGTRPRSRVAGTGA